MTLVRLFVALALLELCIAAIVLVENPEIDLQEVINSHPEYTHFKLQQGVFSSANPIHLKRGNVLEGIPGTIIKQSVIIDSEGTKLLNLNIVSPFADCTTITKPTTIAKMDIGPCTGRGILISGTSDVNVYDSYIHPEYPVTGCCDAGDGLFIQNSNAVKIQGNVIAYGEANIELSTCANIDIVGNFFLNPLGPGPRGQHVQAWNNCNNISVTDNYCISSNDTTKYKFKAHQEDAINFGITNGAIATGNWVTGGLSPSGCGIIADDEASNTYFMGNVLYETGQCGIGIANGAGHTVDANVIYNEPIPGGGNTAIYIWQQYQAPCSTVKVTNNIGFATNSQGNANSFWNGGGCDPVSMSNNTFDAAALKVLTPFLEKYPPPSQVPPIPYQCTAVSPYSSAKKVNLC
jgi:hypothetical protein